MTQSLRRERKDVMGAWYGIGTTFSEREERLRTKNGGTLLCVS